jgi:CheY-like chemotaxis protein
MFLYFWNVTKKINTILLVDDDPDDQLLFAEALQDANDAVLCLTADNGIEALSKLNFGTVELPDLIFMDVNMPRMNGIDCLKEIKKTDSLKGIPVIMYSTSCSPAYQKECFDIGAALYIEKPSDFARLCSLLKQITTQGIPDVKTTSNDNI